MNHKKRCRDRLPLVALLFLAIYLVIGIRLYHLQIYNQSHYAALAKAQYGISLTLQTPRGIIYDRTGTIPLALNKDAHSAFLLPSQLHEWEKTYTFLHHYFPESYKLLLEKTDNSFLWIKRRLPRDERARIAKEGTRDIQLISEPQRHYPFPHLTPIIGFTNIDNDGIEGLELAYNEHLKGTPTQLLVERDARPGNRYFKKETLHQGSPGSPLHLTIDTNLQFVAAEEVRKTVEQFEAQDGAALIMDPKTGEILALVSYPYFDPHKQPIEHIEYIKNIATTECYEFGSVIKVFSALAALEEGVVSLDTEIDCEGKEARFGRFKVENWKSIGKVSFAEAVKHSSNVGMAKVALKLGTKLYDYFQRLGFGKQTLIELPGERQGNLTPPPKWSKSSPLVLSFGYELAATVLQLGKAFSIIANGGFDVQPTILKQKGKQTRPNSQRLFRSQSIEEIKTILESIASSDALPGYRIMGKTGTARIAEKGGYSLKRHVYTFGGIIENNEYKRVIITFIKEPTQTHWWASQITAPLFKRIAQRMVTLEKASQSKKTT